MHKYAFIQFLLLVEVFFAQQAIIISSVPGTIVVPAEAPYTALTDSRIEFRLTGIGTCKGVSSGYANNIINLPSVLEFGCTELNTTSFTVGTGSSTPAVSISASELGGNTDIFIRFQRDYTNRRYLVEAWAPDGTLLVSKNIGSARAGTSANVSGTKNLLDGRAGQGIANIAWLRWYSGVVPPGSTMPKDSQAITGDLGNWEFEGSTAADVLSGTRTNGTLNITKADVTDTSISERASAVSSQIYPPVLQIRVSNALAGARMTLDASDSFAYDGSALTGIAWEYVDGPSTPIFSDRNAITPEVEGLIAGTYVFRLKAQDAAGTEITTVLRVPVENRDFSGLPIYSVTLDQTSGEWPLEFQRDDVPDAVELTVYVRTTGGNTFPPVICGDSPCKVRIDNRQKGHQYQKVYKNAEGKVLWYSEWINFATQQAESRMSVFSPGSWNRWATYLMQNSPDRIGKARSDASGRFFAQRLTQAFLGASRSPAEWNPSVHSAAYIDGTAKYPHETYDFELRQNADARQFTWEKIWLHFKSNISYTVSPNGGAGASAGWREMERFDKFDNSGRNGVLTSNNGVHFTDVTAAVWNGTGATLSRSNDYLYLGYSEPFDEVNLTFATPAAGCAVAWEFWDGTNQKWSGVTPSSNTTSDYSVNGRLMFQPNANWRRVSVDGGHSKWWLRAQWQNCSQWPKIQTLKGWDVRTPEANAYGNPVFPGFCESDEDNSRINKGLTGDAYSLEYEPNPPSSCQARFRWHARAMGIWLPNAQLLNYENEEFGRFTYATLQADYLAPRLLGGAKSQHLTGVYLDSIFEMNTKDFIHAANGNAASACRNNAACINQAVSDLLAQTEYGGGLIMPRMMKHIETLRRYLRDVYPDAQISVNTNNLALAKIVDHSLLEGGNWVPRSWRYVDHSFEAPPTPVWDDYGPGADNPGCQHRAAIATGDTSTEFMTGGWFPWDRGNRGPMAALAGYYVFTNPCVSMFYTVNTPSGYYAYDDYYYWNPTPDVILTKPTTVQSVGIKSIRDGVLTFESPIALTPGSQLFINLTSNASHNEQAVAVGTIVDASTVTTSNSLFTSSSSTGGQAMPYNLATVFYGDFSKWPAALQRPVQVSSVYNGVVTLSAPMSGLAAGAYVYLEGSDNPSHNLMVRVASVVNSSTFKTLDPAVASSSSNGGTATLQNASSSRTMRIGSTGEFATVWKVSDTAAATNKMLFNSYPAGTGLWSLSQGQLSVNTPPPVERIAHWGNYFPAMDIDLGQPISDRQMRWKTAAESNTKNGIQRRDYEKAVVLFTTPNSIWRITPLPPSYGKQPTREQYETYSPAYQIDIDGAPATVYPLKADGRTSNEQCNYGPSEDYRTPEGGCTAIKIRTAEGLVLMKAPIN